MGKVYPDISHHDKILNWDELENNVEFLITKATEGKSYVDPTLKEIISECEKRHIPYWLYTFLNHGDELAQTKFLVSTCKPLVGEYFVGYALDIESRNNESNCIDALNWLSGQCDKQMIYTMYSQYKDEGMYHKLVVNRPNTCAWWEARYGLNNGYYNPKYSCNPGVDLHQYTENGNVPFITKNIDLNIITGAKDISWFRNDDVNKEDESEEKMMVFNVHAGHCPDGKGASGAVGIIKESTEARLVKDRVIEYLRYAGHTVYDCTCDENKTQSGCLSYIVNKCNAHKVDLDISIHFNAGAEDNSGNGKMTGTELWATKYSGVKKEFADRYFDKMKSLGLAIHGKGCQTSSKLYFLNKTSAPAVLIEVCFVDDKDDTNTYKSIGVDKIAKAIAEAICGKDIVIGLNVGDIVKPTKGIKIMNSSAKTKEQIGTLSANANVKILGFNSSKSMAKIADGVWIYTANVEKV